MFYSLFTHDDPTSYPPGKSYRADADGTLDKASDGRLVRSKVETIDDKNLTAVARRLRKLDHRHHLTTGICAHAEALCVPAAVALNMPDIEPERSLPVIARANLFFKHVSEKDGLLIVDADSQGAEITTAEVVDAIYKAAPGLRGYTCITTTSSSSNVELNGTSTGTRGLHIIFWITDMSDIPRALDVLHQRLILTGHGRHKLSATGEFLDRTYADRALRVPSQPVYLKARCEPPVKQRKTVNMVSGDDAPVNTGKAIPDLTPAEQERVAVLLAEAKTDMLPEMTTKRHAYIDNRIAQVKARGFSTEAATRQVMSVLDHQRLGPDTVVTFTDKAQTVEVSVEDILKDPDRWHDKPCLDPLEPDYAGARSVAKFYAFGRLGHGDPCVHSFAHSSGAQGHVYKLMNSAENDFGIIDTAEAVSASVDAWSKEMRADFRRVDAAVRAKALRESGPEHITADDMDALIALEDK